MPSTHHIINADTLALMKPGVVLVNTSRGGLIDTAALINALKSGQVAAAGLDVYEHEDKHFFKDGSVESFEFGGDELLATLLEQEGVLLTGHQAFLTREALDNIAETTLRNLGDIEGKAACTNEVRA